MAATLATEPIFRGFMGDKSRAFFYGHTYCGNALGAAVAREVLRVYRDEKILERAQAKSRTIARAFEALGSLPHVTRPRAIGMIGAVDLESAGEDRPLTRPAAGEDRALTTPAAGEDRAKQSGYLADAGWRVYDAARRRGVYLRPLGSVVYVAPPLNIPDEDLAELLGKVREAIEEVVNQ